MSQNISEVNKSLIHEMNQTDIANQLIQKMKLIQGDIHMDRNHKDNLDYLIIFNGELNRRIARELILGNKVKGFIDLRNEVTEWIKIVSPLAFPEGL